MVNWTNLPDTLVSTSGGTETRQATVSITTQSRIFLRLRALR
jgi:hypothetical protein